MFQIQWYHYEPPSFKDVALQNRSIRRLRTVHMRARLPKIYIGIDISRKKSWIPPMARYTVREPLDSSQLSIKREKTRPCSMSSV